MTFEASKLILALDTADPIQAVKWARACAQYAGMFKVGLELFCDAGGGAVYYIRAIGPVMVDLKLHDIPETIYRTVAILAPLQPAMLTVHAAGGKRMISAARRAYPDGMLLAVTRLTSQAGNSDEVRRLAEDAMEGGADGLVCSPHDANMLRFAFGNQVTLVCPGIRPSGTTTDDHARPFTPRQAMDAGADWLVVGRPITQAADPAEAARIIATEMRS